MSSLDTENYMTFPSPFNCSVYNLISFQIPTLLQRRGSAATNEPTGWCTFLVCQIKNTAKRLKFGNGP